MKIHELTSMLESWAPVQYAESYDNVGLLTGHSDQEIKGVLICLDSTEAIIDEAISLEYNVVIAHHPILFRGIKKLNGADYVERTIIKAIKNDIALYAIHTNLDNILTGVNHQISTMLDLQAQRILRPKVEYINQSIGAGMIPKLSQSMSEIEFLNYLKNKMNLPLIKHTALLNKPILTVAVCGGSGSFLISTAIQEGADVLITSDLKYHEYFDSDQKIILMDIGHFESERYTIDLIYSTIHSAYPNVSIAKTKLSTNPVHYFV